MNCCTSMLEGIFRYNYTWRFKNPLLSYALILMVEAASTYCDETSSIYNSGPFAIIPFTPWTFTISSLFLSLVGITNSSQSVKSWDSYEIWNCWNWLIKWLMFRAGKNHQVSILIYRTHYLARAHDWYTWGIIWLVYVYPECMWNNYNYTHFM